jgi:hypothetical protein
VEVTVTLGGVTRTATKTITVFAAAPAPTAAGFEAVTITGQLTAIAGTAYTYGAAITGPAGSYTYAWSSDDVALGTASTKTITFAAPATGTLDYVYSLELAVTLGGVTLPAAVLITVVA